MAPWPGGYIGLTVFISLIIKDIVLKVGGNQVYTEKLQPLSLGFILSNANMFGLKISHSRFHHWFL